VTGVQIHNWAHDLEDERVPSMEFVAPARAYVVVNGEKIDIDLQQVPAMAPRQLQLLAAQSVQHVETSKSLTTGTPNSMLQEIPRDYLLNRLGGVNTTIHMDVEHQGPSWREYIKTTYHDAHHNAPKMDEHVSAVAAGRVCVFLGGGARCRCCWVGQPACRVSAGGAAAQVCKRMGPSLRFPSCPPITHTHTLTHTRTITHTHTRTHTHTHTTQPQFFEDKH
jgi:hypothetical protein